MASSPRLITHAFAGNPLDRAGDRRSDAQWIARKLEAPGARALVLWKGQPLLGPGPDLVFIQGALAAKLAETGEHLIFLGLDGDDAVFALELEGEADPTLGPLQGLGGFGDMRAAAAALPIPDTGLLSASRSLFEWRRRHRYCSACGHGSNGIDGGWKRQCPSCKTEHFPRVDPCVIMLPTFGDRCLVGRQAAWVANRYSALAGFVEPGESIEEACAREVKEEAGLTVTAVRYHSSQPWPYPSNLMIGLICEVSDDQAQPDLTELESVLWLTKAQARDLVDGKAEGLTAPPPFAIAHALIRDWAEG
ncbi:MAG: NAD(+) diphosphatase [Caulobacteraceae bacterium]